ncbi:unnamed protein product, partial [Larinioides sclopetarius]
MSQALDGERTTVEVIVPSLRSDVACSLSAVTNVAEVRIEPGTIGFAVQYAIHYTKGISP